VSPSKGAKMEKSIDQLIEEAKGLSVPQDTQNCHLDDLEKVASSIEGYLHKNHYEQILSEAIAADKIALEKTASFCIKAKNKGYKDHEIQEHLEKVAGGLLGLVGKGIQYGVGVPLKVGKTLLIGRKGTRLAAKNSAEHAKKIKSMADPIAKKRFKKLVELKKLRGSNLSDPTKSYKNMVQKQRSVAEASLKDKALSSIRKSARKRALAAQKRALAAEKAKKVAEGTGFLGKAKKIGKSGLIAAGGVGAGVAGKTLYDRKKELDNTGVRYGY